MVAAVLTLNLAKHSNKVNTLLEHLDRTLITYSWFLQYINMYPGTLSDHPGAGVQGIKNCCKASEANPAPTAPGVVYHGETTMHANTYNCLPDVM